MPPENRVLIHRPSSKRSRELALRDLLALDAPALVAARDSLAPFISARGSMPVKTPYGVRHIVTNTGFRPHPWELLIDIGNAIARGSEAHAEDDRAEAA